MGGLSSLKDGLDALESLLPGSDLLLDGLPFLEFDFAEHVALDYDHLVELVDFGVDDVVLNGFNGPHFDLFNVDLDRKVVGLAWFAMT